MKHKQICVKDFKSFIELKLWYELKSLELKTDFEVINIQYNETGFYKGYLVFYFLTN